MRPTSVSLTGSGAGVTNSTPIRVNWRQSPFNANMVFTDSGTTTGFTVQWTLDEPSNYASAALWNSGATWISHAVMAGMVASGLYGSLDYPVQGVRLQADANGTDTGTLTFTQGQNG
jgi:hypothetical protein